MDSLITLKIVSNVLSGGIVRLRNGFSISVIMEVFLKGIIG